MGQALIEGGSNRVGCRVGIGGEWDGGQAFFFFFFSFFTRQTPFHSTLPKKTPLPQTPPVSGYSLPGTSIVLSEVAYNT